MSTKTHEPLPFSKIWVAVAVFIFSGPLLLSACDRVPEPTASTSANTLSADQESEQKERGFVNPDDPNLQDAVGSESGVTSQPSDSSEALEDKFHPTSSNARSNSRPTASPSNPSKVE